MISSALPALSAIETIDPLDGSAPCAKRALFTRGALAIAWCEGDPGNWWNDPGGKLSIALWDARDATDTLEGE